MERTSESTATTIGRVAVLIGRPGLDVDGVEGAVKGDIVDAEPLDGLELAVELADAAEGDAQAVVQGRVGNGDVCAVALEGDAVVAVVDGPAVKEDVGGANRVGAVGVGCYSVSTTDAMGTCNKSRVAVHSRHTAADNVASVVDHDVGEGDGVAVDDGHCPAHACQRAAGGGGHGYSTTTTSTTTVVVVVVVGGSSERDVPHLAAQKVEAADDRVGQAAKGDLVRAARVVGRVVLVGDPEVPGIAVAVEGAGAVAVKDDVAAAEDEGRRLVLVADVEGGVEPVGNVCAPLAGRPTSQPQTTSMQYACVHVHGHTSRVPQRSISTSSSQVTSRTELTW